MPNLIGAGDSITRGGTPGSAAYLNSISLSGRWGLGNRGIDGNTVAAMITQAAAIDALLRPGITNVLVVWAGTNDMGNSGATVATTYANLVSYCQARQTAGWTVVVVPMMSRTGTNPIGGESMDTDKSAYNALIDSGWPTFASAEVTLSSLLTANGSFSNNTYFLDGIHPTSFAVTTLIAPEIATAVNPVGGAMSLSVVHTAQGGGAGSLSTITSGAFASTTGNLLVAHVRNGTGTPIQSVKNAAGVAFTSVPGQTASATNFQFWYLKNTTGNASDAVSVVISPANTFTGLFVWEISGADKVSPFDVQAFATGASAATAVTGSYSTRRNNSIILAVADLNAINETLTAGSGYVLDSAGFPAGAGNLYAGAENKIVSAIQSGITTSMGMSPNAAWQMHAGVFMAPVTSVNIFEA